jgi:hypothetical protein
LKTLPDDKRGDIEEHVAVGKVHYPSPQSEELLETVEFQNIVTQYCSFIEE